MFKIARTVFTKEDIELQDGTEIELKPLTIKKLRVFMDIMGDWQEFLKEVAESEDGLDRKAETRSLDLLLDASALCMATQRPEFWDAKERAHTEAWEDVVDMDTIYKIIDACGGMKLNDPEAAARQIRMDETTGTN